MVLEKPDDEKTANIVFALISLQAFSLKCLIIGHGLKLYSSNYSRYLFPGGKNRKETQEICVVFEKIKITTICQGLTNHVWLSIRY